MKDSCTSTTDDITQESVFNERRRVLKALGFVGAGSLLPKSVGARGWLDSDKSAFQQRELKVKQHSKYVLDGITKESKALTHNNFYEFGTQKSDPAQNAQSFIVDPWTLSISGEVEKPLKLSYVDLFSTFELEQRIYRMRCVEAWSMVIPWVGFELGKLIEQAKPNSKAKYVAFKTLYDPKQMPGQASRFVGGGIDYPYVEGLRLDEAMNSLTMLAVGAYGKTLAPQNGAPVRLVVPWKYGFKSIKSIVSIELVDKEPPTTWNILAPNEYGFYANVNPQVDHPRWSQAQERRITSGGLFRQNYIKTQSFNGYGEQVAHIYKDMDLAKFY